MTDVRIRRVRIRTDRAGAARTRGLARALARELGANADRLLAQAQDGERHSSASAPVDAPQRLRAQLPGDTAGASPQTIARRVVRGLAPLGPQAERGGPSR